MNVASAGAELRRVRQRLPAPVGFVPTMGFLHDGHLSLVRRCHAECAAVVVSIFVNPTQFGPAEDLKAYPRDLERDLELLAAVGADLVFAPPAASLYPEDYGTWVIVERLTARLEGSARPTHFRGVTTIVAKLFHLVVPDRAYFGQKDGQQALVIQRMVRDLDFPIELVVGPTVREPDGLAMSSRNVYLSSQERPAAAVLYRCLQQAEALYVAGERDAETIRGAMRTMLAEEPLAQPEYVSIAAVEELVELDTIDRKALVSLAVRIGTTRLIDNTVLPPGEQLL